MTPNEWILGRHTGISSKTIWAVMVGEGPKEPTFCSMCNGYDTPKDPSDFGRCYDLLEGIPEWKQRLGEVSAVLPKWGPFVREWSAMEQLYEEESPTGRCPKLYAMMERLNDEGMIADGWTRKSAFSWYRKSENQHHGHQSGVTG